MAKRTTSVEDGAQLSDIELPLDPDLETAAEEVAEEEVEEEDADEEGDEPEPPRRTTPRESDETQSEFRARLAAEKARGDALAQALEAIQRQNAGYPQQPRSSVAEEDPYKDFTAEAKTYIPLVTRIAEPIIRRQIEAAREAVERSTKPLHENTLAVREMVDDINARRIFKDYTRFEPEINELRAEIFKNTQVIAPREMAYWIVKGRRGADTATTERTHSARKRAKGAATTETPPVQKLNPKSNVLTMEQIARMTDKEAEAWLLKNQKTPL